MLRVTLTTTTPGGGGGAQKPKKVTQGRIANARVGSGRWKRQPGSDRGGEDEAAPEAVSQAKLSRPTNCRPQTVLSQPGPHAKAEEEELS